MARKSTKAAAIQEAVEEAASIKVGDPVTLHTRNPINGKLENPGTIKKLNNGTQAVVSIQLVEGGTLDVPATLNAGDQHYTLEG